MYYLLCTLASLIVVVYFVVDRIITTRRLKINQVEWDAFSAGMSESQKLEVFNDWCRESKIRHGWRHYYFPRM